MNFDEEKPGDQETLTRESTRAVIDHQFFRSTKMAHHALTFPDSATPYSGISLFFTDICRF